MKSNILSDVCPTCGKAKSRSISQNARYWALLTEASERLGEYDKNTWHEYFRQKFLPSKSVNINGEEKLIYYSTANLPMHGPNIPNWDIYTNQVESWLSERGVYLSD